LKGKSTKRRRPQAKRSKKEIEKDQAKGTKEFKAPPTKGKKKTNPRQ